MRWPPRAPTRRLAIWVCNIFTGGNSSSTRSRPNMLPGRRSAGAATVAVRPEDEVANAEPLNRVLRVMLHTRWRRISTGSSV